MTIRRSGFTLMEIMVVIIVISVLASVGGPMVNTITEQGKTSATKAKLDNLRKAILAYQGDVGRLPHTGKAKCSSYIDAYNADAILNNEDADKNVLITDDVFDFNVKRYKRKWNGPYMDSEPYDFMQDSWGNRIQYVAEGKSVYLWSYGSDQQPDRSNVTESLKIQSNEDAVADSGQLPNDIIISIKRFKRALK